MKPGEQVGALSEQGVKSFAEALDESGKHPLNANGVDILQINVGKKCNLRCKHCHVDAGPDRTEVMSKEVLDRCRDVAEACNIPTVDITGGAPELNPHLEGFIKDVTKPGRRVMVRSNLVILLEEPYRKFLDIYTDNNVEIVTSLPAYNASMTDRQRGDSFFDNCVAVLRDLNRRGYGKEGSGLVLDLVCNPVGAYLPGSQEALEHEYRSRLRQSHGIEFNDLFCLTNVPIGRFLEFLLRSGNYMDYMTTLMTAYNPHAVDNVMCKTTVSVGWDGSLYDCDFNQMLELKIDHGAPCHITDFDFDKLATRQIVIHNHCYACTAGAGSSCQGSTTEC
jgi:radical SAM/Cys-rich protein